MHVVIFVVNYKADDHLRRFVGSVQEAKAAADGTTVEVHVLDNSCKGSHELEEARAPQGGGIPISVHSTGRNEGYFGVLPLAQSIVPATTDVILYSNPDLLLDPDFFLELGPALRSGGILAPAIIARDDGFDQNPKYVHRLTERKLKRLRVLYANPVTFAAFNAAARLREILQPRRSQVRSYDVGTREVYAPHGALFVFTDVSFFLGLPPYPCFLFGEELFVAEEARREGVKIVYAPRLRVEDVRHASVSALSRHDLRVYMHQSVSWILSRYYGNGGESAA